jgi:hypothetical protein
MIVPSKGIIIPKSQNACLNILTGARDFVPGISLILSQISHAQACKRCRCRKNKFNS